MTTVDDNVDGADRRMALSAEDEERILERTVGVFRGRTRGWAMLNLFLTATWSAVALWAASAFFRASTTRDWIFSATVFLVSCLVVSLLKIWFWMELNRHAQTREIKRLELQVAMLVKTVQGHR